MLGIVVEYKLWCSPQSACQYTKTEVACTVKGPIYNRWLLLPNYEWLVSNYEMCALHAHAQRGPHAESRQTRMRAELDIIHIPPARVALVVLLTRHTFPPRHVSPFTTCLPSSHLSHVTPSPCVTSVAVPLSLCAGPCHTSVVSSITMLSEEQMTSPIAVIRIGT